MMHEIGKRNRLNEMSNSSRKRRSLGKFGKSFTIFNDPISQSSDNASIDHKIRNTHNFEMESINASESENIDRESFINGNNETPFKNRKSFETTSKTIVRSDKDRIRNFLSAFRKKDARPQLTEITNFNETGDKEPMNKNNFIGQGTTAKNMIPTGKTLVHSPSDSFPKAHPEEIPIGKKQQNLIPTGKTLAHSPVDSFSKAHPEEIPIGKKQQNMIPTGNTLANSPVNDTFERSVSAISTNRSVVLAGHTLAHLPQDVAQSSLPQKNTIPTGRTLAHSPVAFDSVPTPVSSICKQEDTSTKNTIPIGKTLVRSPIDAPCTPMVSLPEYVEKKNIIPTGRTLAYSPFEQSIIRSVAGSVEEQTRKNVIPTGRTLKYSPVDEYIKVPVAEPLQQTKKNIIPTGRTLTHSPVDESVTAPVAEPVQPTTKNLIPTGRTLEYSPLDQSVKTSVVEPVHSTIKNMIPTGRTLTRSSSDQSVNVPHAKPHQPTGLNVIPTGRTLAHSPLDEPVKVSSCVPKPPTQKNVIPTGRTLAHSPIDQSEISAVPETKPIPPSKNMTPADPHHVLVKMNLIPTGRRTLACTPMDPEKFQNTSLSEIGPTLSVSPQASSPISNCTRNVIPTGKTLAHSPLDAVNNAVSPNINPVTEIPPKNCIPTGKTLAYSPLDHTQQPRINGEIAKPDPKKNCIQTGKTLAYSPPDASVISFAVHDPVAVDEPNKNVIANGTILSLEEAIETQKNTEAIHPQPANKNTIPTGNTLAHSPFDCSVKYQSSDESSTQCAAVVPKEQNKIISNSKSIEFQEPNEVREHSSNMIPKGNTLMRSPMLTHKNPQCQEIDIQPDLAEDFPFDNDNEHIHMDAHESVENMIPSGRKLGRSPIGNSNVSRVCEQREDPEDFVSFLRNQLENSSSAMCEEVDVEVVQRMQLKMIKYLESNMESDSANKKKMKYLLRRVELFLMRYEMLRQSSKLLNL